MDELAPNFNYPAIFYYSATDKCSTNDISLRYKHLRNSLSKVLTSFHPLAGRYRVDSHSVDCCDQGVLFVEARVDIRVDDLVRQRMNVKPQLLNVLLPCPIGAIDGYDDPLLALQMSAFSCGGFAIAVCSSHRIVDIISTMSFMMAWAVAAKQELGYVDITYQPNPINFDSASLFPGKMLSCFPSGILRDDKNIDGLNIVTKMFYFNKNKIASIRERARLDKSSKRPTMAQSIFGLIGKAIIDVHVANPNNPKSYTIVQAVNMRNKTVPPLPDNLFGNIFLIAGVQSEVGPERVVELPSFVDCLSNSVNGVVDTCKTVLTLGKEGQTKISHRSSEMRKSRMDPNIYFAGTFTSWCNFPFYQVADFGWGKPIWVGLSNILMKNTVLLLDDKSGEGIEAWVCLDENDMQKFTQHSDIAEILSKL
ncbi:vinorine synthase-like [Apium graveolens]|uniref:vinorine synthase-like n=1 Tax=Apium graveolens TaxID=4045 RepID=UPI003D7BCED0